MSPLLISTWADGVVFIAGGERKVAFAGKMVRGLVSDGQGGAFGITDHHSLSRWTLESDWSTVATHDSELSCVAANSEGFFVGTDDARLLKVDRTGRVKIIDSFDKTPGRDSWYAGSVVINGQVLGPPLGVRSIAMSPDGKVVFANVHVGGIPRSSDGGESWQPTIAVDSDVHEVRVHATRPEIVIAATATGLAVSEDGGTSWSIETEGLPGPDHYCSAVAFAGDDILVAASADHFAPRGAVYRRSIGGGGPLVPLGAPDVASEDQDPDHFRLPRWTGGIVDTACVSTCGDTIAIADGQGTVVLSEDNGRSWSRVAEGISGVSSLLVL